MNFKLTNTNLFILKSEKTTYNINHIPKKKLRCNKPEVE